ncbi:30S ribosomal protein S14 [Natrialba chahannaoensis JCM 10990]|uniref:30S ribosomal protein S14 n=1 Tax=Natrialba chahannaoensis JCM 10990 TaxID=1227492 RepID=M0AGK3_9EURY|nr:30S ribosomal protein S14 [Natrialba chahannaoensis]ELY97002.1 30S ribosomal protein S14 [Natrialba chahannaoensis JCM 10990]
MTDGETHNVTNDSNDDADTANGRTGNQRVCRDTGREQGLIGAYDIWLCRQSFREMARDIGFRKYD